MGSMEKILAELDILERLHRLPDTASLRTSEAAIFLRSSVSALESLRVKGNGPRYIQPGGKGAGSNHTCLYHKSDLLAWQEANKLSSTMEAAVRRGQLFLTLHDVVNEEAFWLDEQRRIVGMVESSPVRLVIDRLGLFDIVWMPVIDAISQEWSELGAHKELASQVTSVMRHQLDRVAAGVEATDIALG
ncbi:MULTISPECIES: hypothetical protein [unclassified Duganella]|uniref:hypothetical protein n=1 Tax=unclassified Duganella TaxID=2636909 RepID=UPI000881C71F|nr:MULTISPECIES: hypothetical protein [unclassified Duganella]SDG06476.1 hypothetical protein SAMN05216320_102537 [Duganella sp. OV458]SDI98725.1 hypothetical protein SAMN05428973_10214 [Duganella sp. OV510]